jgi:hypothetical protein
MTAKPRRDRESPKQDAPDAKSAGIKFEFTGFEKRGGALSKHISDINGEIVSDSSDCRMANGSAWSESHTGMQSAADRINRFAKSEALALGRLKHDPGERVTVVTN